MADLKVVKRPAPDPRLTKEQYQALLAWDVQLERVPYAKEILDTERELRKAAFYLCFPQYKEGSNRRAIPNGWELHATFPMDREVDEQLIESVREPMRALGVDIDTLLEWKPKLKVKAWRQLTAEQKAMFDGVLTTKPGSLSMEIVPPKERTK